MIALRLASLALALVVGIAGPAAAQSVLRIGLNDDPDALDPTISRAYTGRLVFAVGYARQNRRVDRVGVGANGDHPHRGETVIVRRSGTRASSRIVLRRPNDDRPNSARKAIVASPSSESTAAPISAPITSATALPRL